MVRPPVIAPLLGTVRISVLGKFTGLLRPLRKVGIYVEHILFHPCGRYIVGVDLIGIPVSREHVITAFFGHLGRFGELFPVGDRLLHPCGIIRPKDLSGDGSPVREYTGRRLPCHGFEPSFTVCRDLPGIGELIRKFFRCDPDLCRHIQRIPALHIIAQIRLVDNEQVYPVIRPLC